MLRSEHSTKQHSTPKYFFTVELKPQELNYCLIWLFLLAVSILLQKIAISSSFSRQRPSMFAAIPFFEISFKDILVSFNFFKAIFILCTKSSLDSALCA